MHYICPKCKSEYANSITIRKGSLANLSLLDSLKYNTIKRNETITYIDCRKCGCQSTIKK